MIPLVADFVPGLQQIKKCIIGSVLPEKQTGYVKVKKYHCSSLSRTQVRYIGGVRQQIADTDAGLLISCTMVIMTLTKTT